MSLRWTTGILATLLGLGPGLLTPTPAIAETTQESCVGDDARYIPEEPWVFDELAIDAAHHIATGRGVLVAVVDSGVDADNPHLSGIIEPGINLVNDGTAADGTDDIMGHGTAVAGVIAAQPQEGSGVRGIAPNARILPVRVFRGPDDESRAAGFGPDSYRIAEGIRYAADRGAQVINVSLSDTEDIPELRDAVTYATTKGSLVVASAGNRTTAQDTAEGPRYPAAYPQALGVTALDTALLPTPDAFTGAHVDIAAPGAYVQTAAADGLDCVYASSEESTSFATAYVSAAAALQVELRPNAGPAIWHEYLRASALRAQPDRRNDTTGWGLVRPFEALTIVLGPDVPGSDTYRSPEATAIPARNAATTDPNQHTTRLAFTVTGIALLLGAVLWILTAARKPQPAGGTQRP